MAIATKEQERKALEQIRKIVEGLGENSYIATAFEGCFEIAEQNIEFDAAFSMKGQRDIEAQRAIDLGYKVDELQGRIKTLENHLASSTLKVESLKKQVLDGDDLVDIRQLIQDKIYDISEAVGNAAQEIVRLADNPESEEFQKAVRAHRSHSNMLQYCEALDSRVQGALSEQNADC